MSPLSISPAAMQSQVTNLQPQVTSANGTNISGSAYPNQVLAESTLTHYYRLNENSGSVAADAKGGSKGSYSGAYALGSADLLNGPGTSLAVTGSGYASSTTALTTKFSVEFWFELPTAKPGIVALVANANTPGSQKGFLVGYGGSADNELYFYVGNRNGTAHAAIAGGRNMFAPKASYHVVATYDGSSAMALYANGALIASGRFSGGAPDAAESGTTWMGATFSGNIQEVAFYNAPLSAERVAAHYNTGIGSPGATAAPTTSPAPVASAPPIAPPVPTSAPTAAPTPVPTAVPTATPSPTPPPNPVSNPSLSFLAAGAANAQKLTISESGYTGAYTATTSGGDPTTVATSVSGNVITVTPQHQGGTTVIVTGGFGTTVSISAGVTITNITIQ
jgi:hypothetical protein